MVSYRKENGEERKQLGGEAVFSRNGDLHSCLSAPTRSTKYHSPWHLFQNWVSCTSLVDESFIQELPELTHRLIDLNVGCEYVWKGKRERVPWMVITKLYKVLSLVTGFSKHLLNFLLWGQLKFPTTTLGKKIFMEADSLSCRRWHILSRFHCLSLRYSVLISPFSLYFSVLVSVLLTPQTCSFRVLNPLTSCEPHHSVLAQETCSLSDLLQKELPSQATTTLNHDSDIIWDNQLISQAGWIWNYLCNSFLKK